MKVCSAPAARERKLEITRLYRAHDIIEGKTVHAELLGEEAMAPPPSSVALRFFGRIRT